MNETYATSGLIGDAIGKHQSKAYNATMEKFNASVDTLFETMAKANHSEENYVYNKDDYYRMSSVDRSDIAGAVAELTKAKADFTVNSSRINGEYIIEVNKENVDIVRNYMDSHDTQIENYEAPSTEYEYAENQKHEQNTYVENILRAFDDIYKVAQTLESADAILTQTNMQTVAARTDKDFNLQEVLYSDPTTHEVKQLSVDENGRVYLGSDEVTGSKAHQLAETYESVVKEHERQLEKIQATYGFTVGEDLVAKYKCTPEQLNGISEEEKERRLKNLKEAQYKYAAMEAELNTLNGASYRMKGSGFVEKVSTYQTKQVTALCKVINQEYYAEKKELYNKGDATKYIPALEKDFGISVEALGGKLDEKTLYSIRKITLERATAANILLVNKFGKINLKKLNDLSSAQLKAMNLSPASRDLLVKMESEKFGKVHNFDLAKKYGKKALDQDEDIAELRNSVKKSKDIGKETVKEIKKETDVVKRRIEEHRNNRKAKKETSNNDFKSRKTRERTRTEKNLSEKQKNRQLKSGKKGEKKFNKATRRKNSKLRSNFLTNAKNKALGFASRTMVGRATIGLGNAVGSIKKWLVRAAIGFAGLYIKLCMAVCAVVLVVSLISALFEAVDNAITDALSPDDYTETCAYLLVEAMQEMEDDWVNTSLCDFEGKWEDRVNLKYTPKYNCWEGYITSFGGDDIELNSAKDNIVNHPFGKTIGISVTGYTGYRGGQSIDIICNASTYLTEQYKDSSTGSLTYAESGHTSNIKDILAMCDIMFNNSLNDNTDAGIEDYLMTSPAVLSYKNTKTAILNFFKLLYYGIKGLLGDEAWHDKWYESTDAPLASYKTLLNYCSTLFTTTHQESLTLEMKYYEVEHDWKSNLDQTEASYIGFCSKPETCHVPIAFFGTSHVVAPCVNGINLSTKNGTDRQNGKPYVALENAVNNDLCIYSSWKSNDRTVLDAIQLMIDNKKNSCWTSKVASSEDIACSATQLLYKIDIGDGSYPAVNTTEEWFEEAKDTMVSIVQGNVNATALTYANKYSYKVGDNTASKVEYSFPESLTKDEITWTTLSVTDNIDDIKKNYFSAQGLKTICGELIREINASDITVASYQLDKLTITTDGDYGYINIPLKNNKYMTVTLLLLQADANGIAETTSYTRDCKGHDFYFCGGHLAAHVTGQVYSVTNEQLDLCGGVNGTQLVSCDNDYNVNGILLTGKVNSDTLDNSSAATSISTGQAESPLFSINGSYAGMTGLGLITETAGGETKWVKCYNDDDDDDDDDSMNLKEKSKTGYYLSGRISTSTGNSMYLMKDIFDVDTAIWKGSSCFPTQTTSEFCGWTAENMELVCQKLLQDWDDVYGFNIPWNIGDAKTVSQSDIDLIINELKATYGTKFTEEREAIIRTALAQVGWGNYNSLSGHDHGYLCGQHTCRTANRKIDGYIDENGNVVESETITVNWTTSCSVGNSKDFVTFCYYSNGLFDEGKYKSVDYATGSTKLAADYSNVLPADIIYHKGDTSKNQSALYYEYLNTKKLYSKYEDEIRKIAIACKAGADRQDKYVIYLGTLDHDVKLTRSIWHKGKENTTEDYYTIPKDTPIYITLDAYSESAPYSMGSVRLGGFSAVATSVAYFPDETAYDWITNPDMRTKVYSYSRAKKR